MRTRDDSWMFDLPFGAFRSFWSAVELQESMADEMGDGGLGLRSLIDRPDALVHKWLRAERTIARKRRRPSKERRNSNHGGPRC